jgi:hypothetical protein
MKQQRSEMREGETNVAWDKRLNSERQNQLRHWYKSGYRDGVRLRYYLIHQQEKMPDRGWKVGSNRKYQLGDHMMRALR